IFSSRIPEAISKIKTIAGFLIDKYPHDLKQFEEIKLLKKIKEKEIIYLSAGGIVKLKKSFLLSSFGTLLTYGLLIRKNTLGWSGASHFSSPSTNLTRGLVARYLFKVLPCREGTIHLQASMSSLGFEPSPNGTAVSVTNHYTGWATPAF
ncbi:hypothetical protein TNCV_2705851, partial [Trichonephila clavipes]